MNKKMTSGEIAKKAGISQKAVRLYDKKGLLKPSDYSEGNYRLYDDEALLVLEKIIALKQVGFSLEEIRDNLKNSDNSSILSTLQEQIDIMEAKRYELEKAVTRIKAVIARSNGNPDWDDVAEILKKMLLDQRKDAGHFFALDHTKGEPDWYVKVYNSLDINENERILDLGCGYSKVWRNNWTQIPKNVHIDAYDLRESWADDFEKYIGENEKELSPGTKIDLFFEDIEEDATWSHISKDKYSMILAHYVMDSLKDADRFIGNVSKVLDQGGVFSMNGFGNIPKAHYDFWLDVFEDIGIDTKALKDELQIRHKKNEACMAILEKYFNSIEEIVLPSPFTYNNVDEICRDLAMCIPNEKRIVEENKAKLEKYFENKLQHGVVIPHDGGFWRLKK